LIVGFEIFERRLGSDQFAVVMPRELFGLKLFLSRTHNFINQIIQELSFEYCLESRS